MNDHQLLKDVLWTERYRPTTLDELALDAENRQILSAYLQGGTIPHLLLVGPPGSGKTTIARIICKNLDSQVLTLNASSERGIDVVRDKIGSFVTGMYGARWRIVFLDEFDKMTSDAQTALRNMMESYAEYSRFILTANYGHMVISPIQSRCQMLTLSPPPLKERFRILAGVLKQEGIESTPQVILSYAEHYPDLRRMLMATQRAWLGSNGTGLPPAQAALGMQGSDIFAMVTGKNWTGLRRLTSSGDVDLQQALRECFWAIPDEHPRCGFLRHTIGKGVHEMGHTPDPVILFLGVLAEAMEGLN